MYQKVQIKKQYQISFVINVLVICVLMYVGNGQALVNLQPQTLVSFINMTEIKVKLSPIGFKPSTGTLHGKIILADPFSACSDIQSFQNQQDQDIFIMADDKQCMQSIKARNIAGSGAYIGILRRNISNTLHDKQIDAVHIPIMQMQPKQFDKIVQYVKNNPDTAISALVDFSHSSSTLKKKKINLQFWLSPTQIQAYKFIIQLQNFILNQAQKIDFQPYYIIHSHSSPNKPAQYIGCLSSGRFCAPQLQYQGYVQGQRIVSEGLRQKIVANKNLKQWFEYIRYYYVRCLGTLRQNLWIGQNSIICSQGAMISADIDSSQIFNQYKQSFLGSRPQIDSNTYLQQQRQLYLSQKITQYPILLINSKATKLDNTPQNIKIRICQMIHPDPTKQPEQCQKITNKKLFSSGQFMIIVAILINILVCLMMICKFGIKKRMQGEIKNQVESTLGQYYRFMEQMEQGQGMHVGINQNQYNKQTEIQNKMVSDFQNKQKTKQGNKKDGGIELQSYDF